jgi:hypothetical protein
VTDDEAPPEPPPDKPPRETLLGDPQRLRRAAKRALVVYLVLRVALFAIAMVAIGIIPMADPLGAPGRDAPAQEPGWHNLATAWERADAFWYLRIATDGYSADDDSAAFFPLFPLLVRAVSFLTLGNELVAALIVSNACLYASLVLLYLLTAREFDEDVARRSILYLGAFPTIVAAVSPYTESLFLMLVLVCLLAARQERWAIAGLAGALAALTRSVGIVLAPVLAVEAFHRYAQGPDRVRRMIRSLPWSIAPALGVTSYLLYWQLTSGNPLEPIESQDRWLREPTFPLVTPFIATTAALDWIEMPGGGGVVLDWIITMPALAAAVWLAFNVRPAYAVYAWASLLIPMSLVWEPRPFMSMPRFLLPIFPLLWVPALIARTRPGVHAATLASLAALAGLVAALFVTWHFVF